MWKYIYNDMYMALGYLRLGVLVAIAVIFLLYIYKRIKRETIQWNKNAWFAMFIVYVIATVQIAYFSREPGSRNSIDLKLFSTWDSYPQSQAYVIENIIMFIPFGILVPAIWNKMRVFYRCLLAAFVSTVGIEFMQFVTQRGYCQLDDVVMNTLGGIIGYAIFFVIHKIADHLHTKN